MSEEWIGWEGDGPLYDHRDTAQTFFKIGESFHYAGRILAGVDPRLYSSFPSVVSLAFATEAYLKALLEIEGLQAKRTHNLYKLFFKLSMESRKQISGWWDAECLPALKQTKLPPELPKGVEFPQNLAGCLRVSAEAFIKFRYDPLNYSQWNLMSFPAHVRRRILTLRPEWNTAGEHVSAWIDAGFKP